MCCRPHKPVHALCLCKHKEKRHPFVIDWPWVNGFQRCQADKKNNVHEIVCKVNFEIAVYHLLLTTSVVFTMNRFFLSSPLNLMHGNGTKWY